MCVSLGRHMLSAARLSRARSLPPAPVPTPVRGKRPVGLRPDYTQNVAIRALGALQARLNELESAVIPQIKRKSR